MQAAPAHNTVPPSVYRRGAVGGIVTGRRWRELHCRQTRPGNAVYGGGGCLWTGGRINSPSPDVGSGSSPYHTSCPSTRHSPPSRRPPEHVPHSSVWVLIPGSYHALIGGRPGADPDHTVVGATPVSPTNYTAGSSTDHSQHVLEDRFKSVLQHPA